MLTFLVIKDGQEDKARRESDDLNNLTNANVYSYGTMGFVPKPQKDIRLGDVVTVFCDHEFPADVVLISVDSGTAYIDTVSLDGETILSRRYAARQQNVRTNDI